MKCTIEKKIEKKNLACFSRDNLSRKCVLDVSLLCTNTYLKRTYLEIYEILFCFNLNKLIHLIQSLIVSLNDNNTHTEIRLLLMGHDCATKCLISNFSVPKQNAI